MFKISTGTRNYLLATGGLSAALTGKVITIYGGTVPATADADIAGATLLATITVDGDGTTGLSFEETPVAGVLSKSTAQAWLGTVVATGTATFYRFAALADTHEESTTAIRAQGSVAVLNADLLLATVSLVAAQVQRIDSYAIGMPE